MKKKNIEYMIEFEGINVWCDEFVLSANYADNKTVYFSVNDKLIASYNNNKYRLECKHKFNDDIINKRVIVFRLERR